MWPVAGFLGFRRTHHFAVLRACITGLMCARTSAVKNVLDSRILPFKILDPPLVTKEHVPLHLHRTIITNGWFP